MSSIQYSHQVVHSAHTYRYVVIAQSRCEPLTRNLREQCRVLCAIVATGGETGRSRGLQRRATTVVKAARQAEFEYIAAAFSDVGNALCTGVSGGIERV